MKGVGWLYFTHNFFFSPLHQLLRVTEGEKRKKDKKFLWSSEKNSHSFVVLVDDLSPHTRKKNTPIIMHPRVMLCIQRTGFIIIFALFPLPNTCSPLSMLMNSPDGRHRFLWKQPATARNREGERQREKERLTGGRTGGKKTEEKVVCAWMYNFHWKFPLFHSTLGVPKLCKFNFSRLSDGGVHEQLKKKQKGFVGPFSVLELVEEADSPRWK